MMKSTLLCVLLLSVVFASDLEDKLLNGKVKLSHDIAKQLFLNYRSESDLVNLYDVFYNNLQRIVTHNSNPESTWKMGINKFTFMTEEERKLKNLGAQDCSATAELTLLKKIKNGKNQLQSVGDIHVSKDWRDDHIVSPVKDQRHCGSCWSFATTGAVESHWAKKWNITPELLSEQQLIDCAQDFNNFGCQGGLPSQAFEYIKYNKGLQSEGSYSYFGIDGKSCQYQNNFLVALVPGGSVNITAYDEDELLQAVATQGPVTISFQVTNDFFDYKSGVYSNPSCATTPDRVNHAVLAVGYGEENGTKYWIVKNSWSDAWGEKGYFKIKRGVNMCALATCASYPDVNGYQK